MRELENETTKERRAIYERGKGVREQESPFLVHWSFVLVISPKFDLGKGKETSFIKAGQI